MVVLVAMGLVHPARVKRNADAKAGDRLVLGKPLGVGVLSAALKKEQLDAAGYAAMIDTTTRLNTPGPELAQLPGMHAITDVTGFGLAGHALEIARGSGCTVEIDWAQVPLLADVRELAGRGFITGASGRNWAGYGGQVSLADTLTEVDRALLTDPQTSGGLLVSCEPAAVDAVLATFARHGFAAAAPVGRVVRVDDEVVGHLLWAPAVHLPGSAAFATAPVSPDAVLLATGYVDPAHRGQGLGRVLVQSMAKELIRHGGIRAVEAFADARGRAGSCTVPADFLLAVGFATHRAHPVTPRMRMELRSTVRWRDEFETALEKLVPRRRPRPAVRPAPRAVGDTRFAHGGD